MFGVFHHHSNWAKKLSQWINQKPEINWKPPSMAMLTRKLYLAGFFTLLFYTANYKNHISERSYYTEAHSFHIWGWHSKGRKKVLIFFLENKKNREMRVWQAEIFLRNNSSLSWLAKRMIKRMKKNGILDTCLRHLKNWPNACGVAVEYPGFAQFKNNLTDAKLVL